MTSPRENLAQDFEVAPPGTMEALLVVIEKKDALAAHIERLRAAFAACIESDWSVPAEEAAEEALQLDASEALARRDAAMKAEAIHELLMHPRTDGAAIRKRAVEMRDDCRRQAEESRDD